MGKRGTIISPTPFIVFVISTLMQASRRDNILCKPSMLGMMVRSFVLRSVYRNISFQGSNSKVICLAFCWLPVITVNSSWLQNFKSIKGQIKYLVYCMENPILNLAPEKEQLVWLVDFNGFNLSHISLKVTRETTHVLQDHYPECPGLAILYNLQNSLNLSGC